MATTERQAEDKGYQFHGAYDFNKEVIVERAKELRAEGHKAMIVWSPASRYSRSYHSGGWSIYWKESPIVKARKETERKQNQIAYQKAQLTKLHEELDATMAKIAELENDIAKENA